MFKKFKEKRRKTLKDREEKLLTDFLEVRNLVGLTKDDREFVNIIRDDMESVTDYPLHGSEAETALAQLLVVLAEQNWLIIKMLNEINKKLDK